jgi:hypothetical protein
MDQLYDSIKPQMENILKLVNLAMPQISEEVDLVISTKIDDETRIERTIDQLLDFSMLGCGEEQFKRLNEYYFSLNPEAAEFYRTEYNKYQDQ